MRPSTLNLRHQQNHDVALEFLRAAYRAWNERSEDFVVLEHNIIPLFQQLKLFPTKEQVHDILRTSKLIIQSCTNGTKVTKQKSGLSFGEFSILLADIRKLGFASILSNQDNKPVHFDDSCHFLSSSKGNNSSSSSTHDKQSNEATTGPEVFLGGSCNPTTWRADVAIPTLNRLGISFYNPQVSEWTPDLLDLEHRAKEKAKVLFFVMDSQTRSTAGAIEVAYIAGRNSKHLVLVLLPYKPRQKILNEQLTIDEYWDLVRNQQLLKQLVRQRGLPVLDNIPLALENIKSILSGGSCREHPLNIATRLISVRRTYERVVKNTNCPISLTQCQKALIALGYSPAIASTSTMKQILLYYEQTCFQETKSRDESYPIVATTATNRAAQSVDDKLFVTFDGLCILDSYFAVLQQEILETSCISPIKGTNLLQPPIYLTDSPECNYRILPSSVNKIQISLDEDNELTDQYRNHTAQKSTFHNNKRATVLAYDCEQSYRIDLFTSANTSKHHDSIPNSPAGMLQIKTSTNDCKASLRLSDIHRNTQKCINHTIRNFMRLINTEERATLKTRDIYLGGSCWMLTNWRQEYVAPYLKAKNITFYTSSLHEGLEGTSVIEEVLNGVYGEIQMIFNPAFLDASRILLFVITNETRSLGAMTMAAHYIGMGYNVVICVQMLADDCTVKGSQLSKSAVKDYNRGRTYLIDLAERQGIPVFSNIEEALHCAVEKLRIQLVE